MRASRKLYEMPSSSTGNTSLFQIFTGRLEDLGLTYMVTGSVAAMIYGEPRLTHDVDLVLALETDADAERLCRAFPDEEFYCAPLEVVRVEARRRQRGHFNIIHHETGFKADIYLVGADRLHRWAIDHRHAVDLGESRVWLAPPEYVILRKLEYYREGGSQKHISDVRGMLAVSGSRVDLDMVRQKVSELSLGSQWQEVLD